MEHFIHAMEVEECYLCEEDVNVETLGTCRMCKHKMCKGHITESCKQCGFKDVCEPCLHRHGDYNNHNG